MPLLPVAKPELGGNEAKYVNEALASTWISSTGQFLTRFEREFAERCEARHCLAVANGTVALHLALMGMGAGPGDEVLIPSLTYIATANAVRYCGATPVFVDVDPHHWTLDPSKLEDRITARTKGIIAVHLYGHPADMDEINRIASIHGLWVIEDAAEAHFARYKGRTVGSLAHVATFSFYGNKILTSGEGGAVVFDDDHLHMRLSVLRGQGMDPDRRYYFPVIGYNYRLTNIAAAILCGQLERADELQERRRRVYRWYEDALGSIKGVSFQKPAPWAATAPWLFCVLIDDEAFGGSAADLAKHLAAMEIETRPFFIPLHTLPPYRADFANHPCDLSQTLSLARTGLNLPTFATMTEGDVLRVADGFRSFGPAK